jgi:hypothetical protein
MPKGGKKSKKSTKAPAGRITTGGKIDANHFTPADDIQHSGYLKCSRDGSKYNLYWVILDSRKLQWHTIDSPPDKGHRAQGIRQTVDLQYYTIGPPEDGVTEPAFGLKPTFNAPHGIPECYFVCATEDGADLWSGILEAVTTNQAMRTIEIKPPSHIDWKISEDNVDGYSGYLKKKKQGTDWRHWELRMFVLDTTHPEGVRLSWAKPSKVGKATVNVDGYLPLDAVSIRAGEKGNILTDKMFMVDVPGDNVFYFAAEARDECVEWVHILQEVAGQRILQMSSLGSNPRARQILRGASSDVDRKTCREDIRSASMSAFAYVHADDKTWQPIYLHLHNMRLDRFTIPEPNSPTITGEDSTRLDEPFAVQGIAEANGFSIITPYGRHCYGFPTDVNVSRWTRVLQLIWHCTREDGDDPVQLTDSIGSWILESMDLMAGNANAPMQGMLQWSTSGAEWSLDWLIFERNSIYVHALRHGPTELPGPITKTVPLAAASISSLPANLGLYGFTIKREDDFFHVACHDKLLTQTWLSRITKLGAHVPSAPREEVPSAPREKGLDELDDIAALDELDDLNIPSVDEQLCDLAALDIVGTKDEEDHHAPTRAPPTAKLQGVLEIKGKKMFFILDSTMLTGYKHLDDRTKTAEYILSRMNGIQLEAKLNSAFRCNYDSSPIKFRAKTEREADMWVTMLLQLC